jgi:D-lactate dehydrogenase (cytochrome)
LAYVPKNRVQLSQTAFRENGIRIGTLVQESGEDTVDVMRTIKHALDPHNIFNPGKVLRW